MDGNGIDIWRGIAISPKIDALIVTVDLMKRDSEIKLLIGCTEAEKRLILQFHNTGKLMKEILIKRSE